MIPDPDYKLTKEKYVPESLAKRKAFFFSNPYTQKEVEIET